MSEKQRVFIDVDGKYEAEESVRMLLSRRDLNYDALLLDGESIYYHLFISELGERIQTLMNLNDTQWVALAIKYIVDDHEPTRGRNPREFIFKVLYTIMTNKRMTSRQAWVIGSNMIHRLGMVEENYTVFDIANKPYPINGFCQSLTNVQKSYLMDAARIANEPNVMTLERVIEQLNNKTCF